MLRNLVYCTLVAFVSFIAYNYMNDLFVYVGEPVYVNSVYGKLKGSFENIFIYEYSVCKSPS